MPFRHKAPLLWALVAHVIVATWALRPLEEGSTCSGSQPRCPEGQVVVVVSRRGHDLTGIYIDHSEFMSFTFLQGAGIAGLAAARVLLDNGCDVRVLEAKDHLGGRMYSESMDNGSWIYHHGANWLHGDSEWIVSSWWGVERRLNVVFVPDPLFRLNVRENLVAYQWLPRCAPQSSVRQGADVLLSSLGCRIGTLQDLHVAYPKRR
jgi:hypothetical protein